MSFAAVTHLCLLFTVISAASLSHGTCPIPEDQQSLVTGLQAQLMNSVIQQTSPDPSVLIALNLAEALDLCMKTQLVEKIKETVVKSTEGMTSGKVALYVLAFRSSCEDPEAVTTPLKTVNLVNVLEEKTKEEINYFYDYGTLKTTYYQLALDTLALCVEKSLEVEEASIILAKAALANDLEFGGHFSVDTGAVASLALTCVREMSKIQQRELVKVIEEALAKMAKQILAEQSNGMLGNIYSTGLAMQALSVTSEFYHPGAWSCVKTKEKVLHEISLGAFNNPAAAAQILPSLVDKTYLDVRDPTCSSGSGSSIRVQYTITNEIVGPNFSYSIVVDVPESSVLLAVLNAAQCAKPKEFSFQTEQTSWGPMVVSIHNVQASTNEKTYWQFLSGGTPLDQGVGSYKPVNGEHIVAVFSRY